MQYPDIDELFEKEDQQLLPETDRIYPEELKYKLPFFKRYWVKLIGIGAVGLFVMWLLMEALAGFGGGAEDPATATESEKAAEAELTALQRERDAMQGELAVRKQRTLLSVNPSDVPELDSEEKQQTSPESNTQSPSIQPRSMPTPSRVVQPRTRVQPPPIQPRRIAAPVRSASIPTRSVVPPAPTQPRPNPIASRPQAQTQAIAKPDPNEMWNKLASANTFTGSTDGIKTTYRETQPKPLNINPIPQQAPIKSIKRTSSIPIGTKAKGRLMTPLAWVSGQQPSQNVLIELTDDFGNHKRGSLISATVGQASDQLIQLIPKSVNTNGTEVPLNAVQISASNGKPLIAKVKKSGSSRLGRDILNGALGIASSAIDNRNRGNQTISFGSNGRVNSINTGNNNGVLDSVVDGVSDRLGRGIGRNTRQRSIEYFYLQEGTTVELLSVG